MLSTVADDVFNSGTATFTSTGLTGGASFNDFLDLGTAGAGTETNSNLSWFQFGGDAYLVEDNSAALTFQNGSDNVIKLVGQLDLSTAGFSAVAWSYGTLTLA
jgi:hypothetical protein